MKQETQTKASSAETRTPSLEIVADATLPIIASAKTGLAGKDEALVKRPAADFKGSVKDLISFVTTDQITDEESDLASSVQKQLKESGAVVMINGKQVQNLDDPAEKYAVIGSYDLPGGSKVRYRQYEIDVTAVQGGGFGSRYIPRR